MKHGKKQQRSQGGFTFAEVLIAVLIMLMVSVIVATGIPVAQRVFVHVIETANAQTLLSTTVIELRDELGTAQEIIRWTGSDGASEGAAMSVTYRSAENGSETKIWLDKSDDAPKGPGIYIQGYLDNEYVGSGLAVQPHLLVTKKAATDNLHTEFANITYGNGVVTIKELAVYRDGETEPITDKQDLIIRIFSAETE